MTEEKVFPFQSAARADIPGLNFFTAGVVRFGIVI
jgi:hypothetical protein